jgi:hypothetical protein
MRRLRWLIAGVCAAVLIVVFTAFDSVGADCGDAPNAAGSESFECNTAAYLVMAAGLIALAGLLAVAMWAAIEWVAGRRRKRSLG